MERLLFSISRSPKMKMESAVGFTDGFLRTVNGTPVKVIPLTK